MNLQEKINERWRTNLFHICILFAAIGSAAEIIIYMIDSNTRTLFLPNNIYRWRFIYIPSMLNLIVIITTYFCIKSVRFSNNSKNVWSCILIYFLCANTQFIHYVYGPLLMLPCIAIFMSILFANNKLTLGLTICSILSLGCATIVASHELRRDDPQLIIDTVLAVLIIIISYIGTTLMTKYVNEQLDYIIRSNVREKELIEELHLDSLMGIYNRKALHEKAKSCFIGCLKNGECHMLLLDIDDFKKINDSYGHLNGDEVLISLSKLLKQVSTRNIIAYRYGGEEIVLIIQHKTIDEAYLLAEQIRNSFSECRYSFAPQLSVTFSGGIATLQLGQSVEEWFHDADSALYKAKKLGKNQLVVK